jgi:hypothetical protein
VRGQTASLEDRKDLLVGLSLILLIVAGLLFLLDIVLGIPAVGRRAWFLTPLGGLFVVIALLVAGGGISAS